MSKMTSAELRCGNAELFFDRSKAEFMGGLLNLSLANDSCQQQDLFTISIQSLIKDGCEIKQLAINWQDRVNFILSDDLSLKSIKFQDEVVAQAKEMEPETKDQQFDADFLIMTDTLTQVIHDLLDVFIKKKSNEIDKAASDLDNIISLVKTA